LFALPSRLSIANGTAAEAFGMTANAVPGGDKRHAAANGTR
jgi:hypothetical protein